MNILYLYKIKNLDKDKTYIGATKTAELRKLRHLSGFGSKELAKELNSSFEFKVLAVGEERYIFDLEKAAIIAFNSKYPTGYNKTDGGEAGPSLEGSLNPNSKLTEDEVVDIRLAYSAGATAIDLAKKYNISRQTIGTIVRGENWKNTPGPITKGRRKLVNKGLSAAIKTLQKQGLNHTEIAKKVDRSVATVLLHME